MPHIFSKSRHKFAKATKGREAIHFRLDPVPENFYGIIFRRIRWQVKQMNILVPLQKHFSLF